MLASSFSVIINPIKEAIQWIDNLMSKFGAYNRTKKAITKTVETVKQVITPSKETKDMISGGIDTVKSFFGYGNNSNTTSKATSNINTTPKNQSFIEVKVTAEKGTTASTEATTSGGISLKNMEM